jgi:hypothetical protein
LERRIEIVKFFGPEPEARVDNFNPDV